MKRQANDRGARDYSDVPLPKVGRSRFDRSYSLNTAFNAGDLVPVYREELLPADTISIRPTVFARLTSLVQPVFSNVYLDVHFFAIPWRHIWENAEEFFGAEPNGPGTRVDRVTPKLDLTTAVAEQSLHDYIGIPPGVTETDASRQPHNGYGRAYSLVFNEWFRDAELQAPVLVDRDDTADDPTDYPIRKRNKQRDRFTSARPWPYKGPDVNLSLGTSATVTGDIVGAGVPTFEDGVDGTPTGQAIAPTNTSGALSLDNSGWTVGNDVAWTNPALSFQNGTADLATAIGPTVNDFRNTIAIQHLFEMFSRGGSARYVELLDTVYGVRSPDARQFRPEFLGSMTTRIMVNPVAITAGTVAGDIGDFGAYAVGAGSGSSIQYSSTEHQLVLGIASVRTEYLYSQGLDKDLTRDSRFDFHWPAFEGLGEQPIRSAELYWQGTADDDDVFGYEPRFQEYRERMNMVTGRMRPDSSSTLAVWHLGQQFSTQQLLNESFIAENPPFDRVTTINASVEPSFKVDIYHQVTMNRPVSAMGMPGLRRI